MVTFAVLFSALFGAITWDLITWCFGLPTSSSHALIGGYGGAAVAKAGFTVIVVSGWTKTLAFIVVSPLIGLLSGLLLMTALYRVFRRQAPGRIDRWFRRLQLDSAGGGAAGRRKASASGYSARNVSIGLTRLARRAAR